MRVRAKGNPQNPTQKYVGFYNYVRREPGDVFDLIDDKHFSKKWMEKVEPTAPKTPAPGEPTAAELAAEQEAAAKLYAAKLAEGKPAAVKGAKGKPVSDTPTGEKDVI